MSPARQPGLDAVRAIACLLVIALHALPAGDAVGRVPFYAEDLRWIGAFGVDLFFALSGYLITGILLDDLGKPAYFRVFYARRALRILPLYYTACVLAFIVFRPWLSIDAEYQYTSSNQTWWWFHGVNLFRGLYGNDGWGNLNHFWSLGIEEQFYLFWPLVVFLCHRRLPIVCAGILALSPGIRQVLMAGWDAWYLIHFDGLVAGALLAWAVRHVPMRRIAFVCGGAAAVGAAMLWTGSSRSVELLPKAAVATGLVLAGSAWNRWPSWLLWVGRRSYCLYVAHYPIMQACGRWRVLRAYPTASHLVYLAMTLAMTCIIAELSWRLIEAPMLRLKPAHRTPRSAAEVTTRVIASPPDPASEITRAVPALRLR